MRFGERVMVRPCAGCKAIDAAGKMIPQGGAPVTWSPHFVRRLNEGSIEIVSEQTTQAAPAKAKAKNKEA